MPRNSKCLSVLFVSASALAGLACQPALAQDGSVPEVAPGQSMDDGENTAASQSNLEEIVVTAQRRSERQQDVPIAISTLTAASAERTGVTGTESLGVAVPSIQFTRTTANGGTPYLRGVGSAQASEGAESPVAVYVDDVYVGAPSSTIMQFNNIDSTEVLKGPQGTLFGRNATGGVVHIHTRKPSHETSFDGTVGGGSYGTYYGSAYATGGITDTVAVNLAVAGQNQSKGYGRNAFTGEDIFKTKNIGVRSQLLWEPSADTTVLISGDYSRSKGDQGQNVVIAPGTVASGGATHQGRYRGTAMPGDYAITTNYGFSGKIEQALGDYRIVSISAYRNSRLYYQLDADGSLPGNPPIVAINVHGRQHSFSQELQLMSPQSDAFRWILGGFYYRNVAGNDPARFSGLAFTSPTSIATSFAKQYLNSYAAFGEASYEFLPDTKITAGLRYTSDHFSNDVRLYNAAGTILAPSPFRQHDSFSKLTYRVILDRKISRDIMVYGSYSRGFKSGGYNVGSPTIIVNGALSPAPVVEPEVLDAYEIGAKTELFGRMLRLNVSAFHYDYSNLQVTTIVNATARTLNAARARMNGADIDYTFAPSSRLTISGGLAFLDSKFKSFPSGPYYVPNPGNCTTLSTTGPRSGGNLTCTADLSGNRTPRAPKFTASTSVTYTMPTDIGDISGNVSLYHNAGFFWESDNRFRQPRYNLLNASIGWTSPDKKFEARIYARNLLDEYYYSYFSETSTRDAGSPEMPRNFGGSLSVHF